MSDLIERRAAIDEIEERKYANGYRNVAVISELNRLEGYIMRLPSAQPERKKGKWISSDDFDEYYSCSECRKGETQFDGLYRYCPWCGARMDEVEKDE